MNRQAKGLRAGTGASPNSERPINTVIRRDGAGRYCLNDLHRASGGEERHSPNRWTRTDGYSGLVQALTPEMAYAPAESIRGGSAPGTYVVEELVIAYAAWISPAFNPHRRICNPLLNRLAVALSGRG